MVSNALNIDSTFVNKKLNSLCNRKTNGIGFHNIHHLSYTAVILRLKAYGSYGRFVRPQFTVTVNPSPYNLW